MKNINKKIIRQNFHASHPYNKHIFLLLPGNCMRQRNSKTDGIEVKEIVLLDVIEYYSIFVGI